MNSLERYRDSSQATDVCEDTLRCSHCRTHEGKVCETHLPDCMLLDANEAKQHYQERVIAVVLIAVVFKDLQPLADNCRAHDIKVLGDTCQVACS